MNIMHRIRLYHATLASLAILAYVTGDLGIVHAWLGYGVALVITLRLLWALSGNRQVGLMRFYPSFDGLQVTNMLTHPSISKSFMLGIALSLLAVTATGIAMDRGKAVGITNAELIATARADDGEDKHGSNEDSFLSESHELFANMLLLFVGMHVAYIVLFKLPLAKFMLFIPKPASNDQDITKHR